MVSDKILRGFLYIGKISQSPGGMVLTHYDGLNNLGRGSPKEHFCQVISQLAFYVNLHRAVIGPSATLTGRWRPDIDLRRMLTGILKSVEWSTQGYHFFQTLLGSCPQCYIPSPITIGPLVPEKIFKGFLPYMGMVAILVIWPRWGKTNFPSPYRLRIHMKFGFYWPSGLWVEDG